MNNSFVYYSYRTFDLLQPTTIEHLIENKDTPAQT